MAKRGSKPGPVVVGAPLTGRETTREVLERAFQAFVGRELRTAYQIIRRMILEDHTIVLALSGAMTPASLHTTCLIPLIKAGIIDILVTTGANIYHDLQRALDGEFFAVDPTMGDIQLRRSGLTRIYDLVFPEDDLFRTDKFVQKLLTQKAFQRRMTTPEFHDMLGRFAAQLLKEKAQEGSLTVQAHRARVPVFCGAPQDGSIYLNVAYLKRKLGDAFQFGIDIETDIHEFGAYHWLAKHRWSKKLSIIILGGGVPKNYSLQPEPYLSQICGLETEGYDCDVQICDAHVQNGGLSSATAGEGHTWGKVSAEFQKNSQYVFADVTAVFPFIVHALLQEGLKKTPRRLLDRRDEALALLDQALGL
ncbi:MAG: deoxyhypusine synthase family protein [Candidatus Bipolaricaulota bacterium]|nr:deoxyhypusine synthase family protein [Candidatus Bipolaricaulota bacterium]MDW8031484.1 deoxyhypusine synthase family protein [Candidatus Bipolaricaulota bacterium]